MNTADKMPILHPFFSPSPRTLDLKTLKVGDLIEYGKGNAWAGDGGCAGQDDAYTVSRRVLKVLGRGRFEVESQFRDLYKDRSEIFSVDSDGLWLRHSWYTVYSIKGITRPPITEEILQRRQELAQKKQDDKKKKIEENWRRGTIEDLRGLIREHFRKQNKRITNLKTASKAKLIEFIVSQKIRT
jgi:hypothetical protein